jgi:nucleoside-specific outer membrane channel protein Tsx
MNGISKILFLPLLALGAGVQQANAFDWTASDIQVLHGNDFEFGVDERTTVTVEHGHGWQYGTNFFFADIADRGDIGVEVYAEVYSYLSMNKITGRNWSLGPVKDVSLVSGLNIGNEPESDNFKAYLLGLSFDLANPAFDYLQLDVTAYKADDIAGKYGVQITPVWSLPFEIAGLKFKFRGFTDFRTGNTNGSGNFHILAQPQLLFDVGDLAGWKSDKIYVGTEYSLWHNKFGVKGVDESVVQAMIIGFF